MPALIDTIRDNMQQLPRISAVRMSADAFNLLQQEFEKVIVHKAGKATPPKVFGVPIVIEKAWEGVKVVYE